MRFDGILQFLFRQIGYPRGHRSSRYIGKAAKSRKVKSAQKYFAVFSLSVPEGHDDDDDDDDDGDDDDEDDDDVNDNDDDDADDDDDDAYDDDDDDVSLSVTEETWRIQLRSWKSQSSS